MIVCDENGFGQTKDMPYGVYTVHQTSGWEGRELMDDFDVFISQNGQTYRYLINNAIVSMRRLHPRAAKSRYGLTGSARNTPKRKSLNGLLPTGIISCSSRSSQRPILSGSTACPQEKTKSKRSAVCMACISTTAIGSATFRSTIRNNRIRRGFTIFSKTI